MTRYNVDWTSLHSEPDEDTLTWREAMGRPGPIDQQPVSSLGNSFMWGHDTDDKRRTDWMDDAACKGSGVELFFPEDGNLAARWEAAQVCATCPVFAECDDYANGVQDGETVAAQESDGIWAGRLHSRNVKSGRRGAVPAPIVCSECSSLFQPMRTPSGGQPPKTCSAVCSKERQRRKARERDAAKRVAS